MFKSKKSPIEIMESIKVKKNYLILLQKKSESIYHLIHSDGEVRKEKLYEYQATVNSNHSKHTQNNSKG
jgi:hypothetical protein